MHDQQTLDFYNAEATTYAGARPDGMGRELADFLPRLTSGAHVLELGCGTGIDAAAMEALGFQVTATDGSPAMAALASERLGRPVPVLRFDALTADARFDAVVACASLLHVPRASLPDILARISRALKSGGWHFASYKTAAPAGRDRFGRYYNRLSQAEAEQLYSSSGIWAELHFSQFDGAGYLGEPSRWLVVTGRKPA